MPSPCHRYRVLYVGNNYALLKALQDRLTDLDCLVVRCPANGVPEARTFIGSSIPYTVFLFDEVLSGETGEGLACFARSLLHRVQTPVFILKEFDDVLTLADRVRRLLGTGD